MALQKHLLLPFILIFLSSLSCYTTTFHGYPPHNYLQQEFGYDFRAHPSFFDPIDDDTTFGNSINLQATNFRLKKIGEVRSLAASVNTVSVDNFGAKGDGRTDDTEAFKKAWKVACSSSTGAVNFVVPNNKNYLLKPVTFSGPCKSALTMQIYGTIKASDDRSDYKEDGKHWLLFDSVQNLLVEGGGIINGNGNIWWKNSCKINKKLPCKSAPTALTFYNCKNLVVTKLKMEDAQQIHISFEKCVNVVASNLVVTAPENSPNTDGIHVTNTQNIQIKSCVIGTGDDCISIVSGSKKVQATDITCGPGHGISIGSLGSGHSEDYVSDVMVNGAKFLGTTNGVRIKTWQGGSGSASNIKFQNVEMQSVSNPIIIDQNYCDQDDTCKEQELAVQVKNVVYQNIKGTSASQVAIKFDCSKSTPCQGIVLQNINIEGDKGEAAKALCNNVNFNDIGAISPKCPN
ncbi:polygalacturonase-like [Cornus florida]|uniref:polygalacturonase-like n=1 Tax=Cornus florida TaxID=4283 RepID=UPI00289699A5|nr:polygalacturonase-like [Cornus florida]